MTTRAWVLVLVMVGCGGSSHDSDAAIDDAEIDSETGDSSSDGPREDTAVEDAPVGDARRDTGFVDGSNPRAPMNHRPTAPVCSHERDTLDFTPPVGGGDENECESHADCTEGENGRCGYARFGTQCSYDTCFADDDCSGDDGRGGVCDCEDDVGANHCLVGSCTVDQDCGENGFCSPSYGSCGNYFGVVAYYCHTQSDECLDDSECVDDGGGFGPGYCAWSDEASHWTCQYTHCAG